jgi:hypothetical protein
LHDEAVRHVGELWQQPWFQARLRLGALLLGQIGSAAARSPTASRAALASLADDVYVGVRQTAEAGTRSGRPAGSRRQGVDSTCGGRARSVRG